MLAAWKHPDTQAIVNRFTGIELEIMFDNEIGYINSPLIDQKKKVTEMSLGKKKLLVAKKVKELSITGTIIQILLP